MKKLIRSILIGLKIPVTQNIRYDILTKELMKKVLRPGSNCIDIGGFKGEIMDEILKFSPAGGGYTSSSSLSPITLNSSGISFPKF